MHTGIFQHFVTRIARFGRAGLTGFLLLNLVLLHAALPAASANSLAPAFSNEIQSPGFSLQRDQLRITHSAGSELVSGSDNDSPVDASGQNASPSLFVKHTDSPVVLPEHHTGASLYAYFIPEPRAAPHC